MSKINKNKNYISTHPETVLVELKNYINTAVQKYGIIPMRELVDIINSQKKYSVTVEDIKYVCIADAGIYAEVRKDYVINQSLAVFNDSDYLDFLSSYKGKYEISEADLRNYIDNTVK